MERVEELLPDVKRYLRVTWTDNATDGRIKEAVASGVQYIEWLAGRGLTFALGSRARQLLLDYCLYVWHGRLADFGKLYERDINTFQLEEGTRNG